MYIKYLKQLLQKCEENQKHKNKLKLTCNGNTVNYTTPPKKQKKLMTQNNINKPGSESVWLQVALSLCSRPQATPRNGDKIVTSSCCSLLDSFTVSSL